MDSRKLLALSLSVSMLGTLALYAYSWTVNPKTMCIGEIGSEDVGAFVSTEGHVRRMVAVGSGGYQIELVDYSDFSSITVFLPGKIAASIDFMERIVPGSKLRVAGEVQEFGGAVEIAVSDVSMIQLLADAHENRLGLDTLALNPGIFDGMEVLIGGKIGDITRAVDWDRTLISSGGDSLWVEDAERDGARGTVDVFGVLLYNEQRRRFEIKVAGGNDSITPHPAAIPESYEVVTIEQLTATPVAWEGRRVAVLAVEAMAGEIIGTSFTIADAVGGERYYISCVIFSWDWQTDRRGATEGMAAELEGTWGYYEREAQWQVTSGDFTLRLL